MSQAFTDDEAPFPRRRVWLGRAVLAAVVFLLAFFVVRIGAEMRLEKMMARWAADRRARGEPVTAADFVSRPIPDEDNAAFYLGRAGETLYRNKTDVAIVDNWNSSTRQKIGLPAIPVEADKLVSRNVAVLADILRADQCHAVRWPPPQFPDVTEQRGLAKFLAMATLSAHQQGQEVDALNRLHDIGICVRLYDQQPLSLTHVIAMQGYSIQAWLLERIAPELALRDGGAPATNLASRVWIPADRAQLIEAIRELLDNQEILRGGVVAAIWEQPLASNEAFQALADGAIADYWESPSNWKRMRGLAHLLYPVRPLYTVDMLTARAQAVEMARGLATSDMPAATTILGPLARRGSAAFVAPSALWFRSDGLRLAQMEFTVIAQRHKAAIALAVRLRDADVSTGAAAKNSTDWIAKYLGHWPDDPMAAAGTPLAYPGIVPPSPASQPGR